MKRPLRSRESGFTMIEVMIAVLLTVIAVIGIIALFMTETRASSYSRRATEATSLATDKLEKLRTEAAPASGTDTAIDTQGATGGVFDRKWEVTVGTSFTTIKVRVGWDDDTATASCSTDASCTASGFCMPSGNCAARVVTVNGRRNN